MKLVVTTQGKDTDGEVRVEAGGGAAAYFFGGEGEAVAGVAPGCGRRRKLLDWRCPLVVVVVVVDALARRWGRHLKSIHWEVMVGDIPVLLFLGQLPPLAGVVTPPFLEDIFLRNV